MVLWTVDQTPNCPMIDLPISHGLNHPYIIDASTTNPPQQGELGMKFPTIRLEPFSLITAPTDPYTNHVNINYCHIHLSPMFNVEAVHDYCHRISGRLSAFSVIHPLNMYASRLHHTARRLHGMSHSHMDQELNGSILAVLVKTILLCWIGAEATVGFPGWRCMSPRHWALRLLSRVKSAENLAD